MISKSARSYSGYTLSSENYVLKRSKKCILKTLLWHERKGLHFVWHGSRGSTRSKRWNSKNVVYTIFIVKKSQVKNRLNYTANHLSSK